jgi:hypothetical protein
MPNKNLSVEDKIEIEKMTDNPFFDSHIGRRGHMSVVSMADMAMIEKGGAVLLPDEKDFAWAYALEKEQKEAAKKRVAAKKAMNSQTLPSLANIDGLAFKAAGI